jgi:hypothetical protein
MAETYQIKLELDPQSVAKIEAQLKNLGKNSAASNYSKEWQTHLNKTALVAQQIEGKIRLEQEKTSSKLRLLHEKDAIVQQKAAEKAAQAHIKSLKQIEKEAERAGQAIKKSIGNGLETIQRTSAIVSAAIAVGLAGIARAAINAASEVEKIQNSLEAMLGTQVSGQLLTQISSFSMTTPFERNNVAEATKLLIGYGVAADQVINKMRTLGDASYAMGRNLEEVAQLYGRIGTGGFEAESLGSIGLGSQYQSLRNTFRTQGGTAAQDAFLMMLDTKFSGSMKKAEKSFLTAWSNFMDTVNNNLLTPIGKAISPALISLLNKLSEAITPETGRKLATAAGIIITSLADKIVPTIEKLADSLSKLSVSDFEKYISSLISLMKTSAGIAIGVGAGRFVGDTANSGYQLLRNLGLIGAQGAATAVGAGIGVKIGSGTPMSEQGKELYNKYFRTTPKDYGQSLASPLGDGYSITRRGPSEWSQYEEFLGGEELQQAKKKVLFDNLPFMKQLNSQRDLANKVGTQLGQQVGTFSLVLANMASKFGPIIAIIGGAIIVIESINRNYLLWKSSLERVNETFTGIGRTLGTINKDQTYLQKLSKSTTEQVDFVINKVPLTILEIANQTLKTLFDYKLNMAISNDDAAGFWDALKEGIIAGAYNISSILFGTPTPKDILDYQKAADKAQKELDYKRFEETKMFPWLGNIGPNIPLPQGDKRVGPPSGLEGQTDLSYNSMLGIYGSTLFDYASSNQSTILAEAKQLHNLATNTCVVFYRQVFADMGVALTDTGNNTSSLINDIISGGGSVKPFSKMTDQEKAALLPGTAMFTNDKNQNGMPDHVFMLEKIDIEKGLVYGVGNSGKEIRPLGDISQVGIPSASSYTGFDINKAETITKENERLKQEADKAKQDETQRQNNIISGFISKRPELAFMLNNAYGQNTNAFSQLQGMYPGQDLAQLLFNSNKTDYQLSEEQKSYQIIKEKYDALAQSVDNLKTAFDTLKGSITDLKASRAEAFGFDIEAAAIRADSLKEGYTGKYKQYQQFLSKNQDMLRAGDITTQTQKAQLEAELAQILGQSYQYAGTLVNNEGTAGLGNQFLTDTEKFVQQNGLIDKLDTALLTGGDVLLTAGNSLQTAASMLMEAAGALAAKDAAANQALLPGQEQSMPWFGGEKNKNKGGIFARWGNKYQFTEPQINPGNIPSFWNPTSSSGTATSGFNAGDWTFQDCPDGG